MAAVLGLVAAMAVTLNGVVNAVGTPVMIGSPGVFLAGVAVACVLGAEVVIELLAFDCVCSIGLSDLVVGEIVVDPGVTVVVVANDGVDLVSGVTVVTVGGGNVVVAAGIAVAAKGHIGVVVAPDEVVIAPT